MERSIDQLFTAYSREKLSQDISRIEACLKLIPEEEIWTRGSEAENAVGNLLLHLAGNVRQWIISGVGGAADVRDRDSEFDAREGSASTELLKKLQNTVVEAQSVIERLSAADLTRTAKIQGYDVTVLEAVYHVVEHFGQHTAQIILLTKQLSQKDLGFYAHLKKSRPHNQTTP